MNSSQTKTQIWVVENGQKRARGDRLATEEPLEIRLVSPQRTVAVTMRSPGGDLELAAGFLYSEGVVSKRSDIENLSYCVDPEVDGEQRYNIVNVKLKEGLIPDLQPLERHFYTTSACGVCGKASLEHLRVQGCAVMPPGLQVSAEVIYSLPAQLRAAQRIFDRTGGLHAAALFDREGELLSLKEDVGRHNALDKLIGTALLGGQLPLSNHMIMVSGRASFELLQKSLRAGVPIVCAVSAPSSLAVSLAREFNITLVGFLREQRFNVYTAIERICLK
ncbi:MAG: formate dehydrogenase accessory sulfurtransferase FdhD [Hormoscilla sp. GUM202]|nr:formate dehydrogenase accessory sulfurtransferase FdhD [Hormoscilla sp. GUM202]